MKLIYILTRVLLGLSFVGVCLQAILEKVVRQSGPPQAATAESMAESIGMITGRIVAFCVLFWVWRVLGTEPEHLESSVKSKLHLRFRGCVMVLLSLPLVITTVGTASLAAKQGTEAHVPAWFGLIALVMAVGFIGKGIEMLRYDWDGTTPERKTAHPEPRQPTPTPGQTEPQVAAPTSPAFFAGNKNSVRLKF